MYGDINKMDKKNTNKYTDLLLQREVQLHFFFWTTDLHIFTVVAWTGTIYDVDRQGM